MNKVKAPYAETGGAGWSILGGRYDPLGNPVTPEAIDDIRRRVKEEYPNSPPTVIDRMVEADTLLYGAGLCNPGLLEDEQLQLKLRTDFGIAALMLFRSSFSALQTHLKAELGKLGNPQVPIYDVIDDLLAKEIINSYKAAEFKTITDVVVVGECGGDLPLMRPAR